MDPIRSPAVPVTVKRRPEPPATEALSSDIHPLLSRLYRARGVRSDKGCSLPLSALHPFESLMDIELAADLLAACVRKGGSILVIGDYDADGATGSALAVRGLRAMGASRVSYLMPSWMRTTASWWSRGCAVSVAGAAPRGCGRCCRSRDAILQRRRPGIWPFTPVRGSTQPGA